MERAKTIHRKKRARDPHPDIRTKKDDRKIIIKSRYTIVKVFDFYIEVITKEGKVPISFINFSEIYLNKTVKIRLNDLYRLSKYVKVYIIDENGYFLAKVIDVEEK